jgi:hypothetical protein
MKSEPFADSESDDCGMVSSEEIFVAGFEFPIFLLRDLMVPCGFQLLLGFV